MADLDPSVMMELMYIVGKMQHYGTNGKDDGKMEGIPVDLDERSGKTVAKTEIMWAWAFSSGSAGINQLFLARQRSGCDGVSPSSRSPPNWWISTAHSYHSSSRDLKYHKHPPTLGVTTLETVFCLKIGHQIWSVRIKWTILGGYPLVI